MLQLLFIDIQVGSIATSLEAAAVVGEMEDGGWSEGREVYGAQGEGG